MLSSKFCVFFKFFKFFVFYSNSRLETSSVSYTHLDVYKRQYVKNNSNAYWLDDEIVGTADVFAYDKTRIVVNFAFSGVSGYDAAQVLNSRFDIKVELCDDLNIVCIFTPYNKLSDVKKLAKAIVAIAGKTVGIKELSDRPSNGVTHAMKLTPRDAFFADAEPVELKNARCV